MIDNCAIQHGALQTRAIAVHVWSQLMANSIFVPQTMWTWRLKLFGGNQAPGQLLLLCFFTCGNVNYSSSQSFFQRSGWMILQAVSVFILNWSIHASASNSGSKDRESFSSCAIPKVNLIWSQCIVMKISFLIALSPPILFKMGIGSCSSHLCCILWRTRNPVTWEFW